MEDIEYDAKEECRIITDTKGKMGIRTEAIKNFAGGIKCPSKSGSSGTAR